MTTAEYFTCQFYLWESRGRGWLLADRPVHLEPPFIPFVRHLPKPTYVDDGRRPTFISNLIESLSRKKKQTIEAQDDFFLDYETIEPFAYTEESNLSALQVKLPKERLVIPENMKALLTMLSSAYSPVSFEIIGNASEIIVQFVCQKENVVHLQSNINAYFSEIIVLPTDTFIENILVPGRATYVTDFGLRDEFIRPLATSKNFKIDPLTGLCGVLEGLTGNMQGGMQILFSNAVNGWGSSILHAATLSDGSSFFEDSPESPKLALEKVSSPLFGVTIRAFGQGETESEAIGVLERVSHSIIKASASLYNCLIPLPNPEYDFEMRTDDIYLRISHRLGMLLSTDELVNILHFPSENIHSRKLLGKARRTKKLPAVAKGKPFVFGENIHNGVTEKVTTGANERLKHTHIIGATGTGKSTMLLSMIAQDIALGNGVAVLDPHGDLIESVLTTIPERRIKDVIVIDPADANYPIGFNILQAHSDVEKEILSSDLVAVFRRNSTSWGDQMNSVFGNALIAFLESEKGGTLADLRKFLIEKSYRQEFLQTVTDPSIRYYWEKEYGLIRTNSIGPILTRLDTFLRPRLIRNMVCQKKGLNFEDVLDSQKILLVKLSQGLIGIENSYLLGSFVVSKIHQAALARQSRQIRNDFFFFIDEFQHFITPSMSGILSGARKYHLGLILAHQDLQQLFKNDSEIGNSVIGNAGTRICFRLGDIDAKRLSDGFSFFEAQDLQNLDTGEAIVRIERPEFDFSLNTISVKQEASPDGLAEKIIAYSRENYATPRAKVEEELARSLHMPLVERVQPSQPTEEAEDKSLPENIKSKQTKKVQEVISFELVQQTQVTDTGVDEIKEKGIVKNEESQHRYLQMLIKRMAESRGYKTTIEVTTPDGKGKIDILLEKDDFQIACEVCVTTDVNWEIHNIRKCLDAGYSQVVSCVSDKKNLPSFQKRIQETFNESEQPKIFVVIPEEFFNYLDVGSIDSKPTETIIKGYRVNLSYDSLTESEMKLKRGTVSKIIAESIRRKKTN